MSDQAPLNLSPLKYVLWPRRPLGNPTSFAVPAGVEAVNALTFKLDHSMGADQSHARLQRASQYDLIRTGTSFNSACSLIMMGSDTI